MLKLYLIRSNVQTDKGWLVSCVSLAVVFALTPLTVAAWQDVLRGFSDACSGGFYSQTEQSWS